MCERGRRCERGMSAEEREVLRAALHERDGHLRWTHKRLERLEGLVLVVVAALVLSLLVRC